MRYRDPRQARELGFAELLRLALENTHRSWPTEPAVSPIHLGQQLHIPAPVLDPKAMPPVRFGPHHSVLPVLANQPRQLRQAQPGHLAQVGANRPAPLLALFGCVLLSHQHPLYKLVSLGSALARKFDGLVAFEKFLDLLRREPFCVLHAHFHPAADSPVSSYFQDHLASESTPVSGSSCIGQFCRTERFARGLSWPSRRI